MSSTLRNAADKVFQTFTPDDHREVKADAAAASNTDQQNNVENRTANIKDQGNIGADGTMAAKAQKDTADRSARYGGSSQPTQ